MLLDAIHNQYSVSTYSINVLGTVRGVGLEQRSRWTSPCPMELLVQQSVTTIDPVLFSSLTYTVVAADYPDLVIDS